jgi:uracil phosphoribosyltransferase
MAEAMNILFPSCPVGFIGIMRDEETHKPGVYYCKLPDDIENHICFVVDPMLATGGTLIESIRYLRKAGVKDIRVLTLVSCPEGISAVLASDPDVRIFTCSVDRCLNDDAYILPGLADAGDRIFGTESGK